MAGYRLPRERGPQVAVADDHALQRQLRRPHLRQRCADAFGRPCAQPACSRIDPGNSLTWRWNPGTSWCMTTKASSDACAKWMPSLLLPTETAWQAPLRSLQASWAAVKDWSVIRWWKRTLVGIRDPGLVARLIVGQLPVARTQGRGVP